MSRTILYHSSYSPFSRSVLLLCRFLKLDVEVKELNLLEDEQMSSEFVEINPQHCVPTIIDNNGFVLWESRAILSYLAESKGQHLVPTSPREKAILNQRLYSEMGGIAVKYAEIFVRPISLCSSFLSTFHYHSSAHFLMMAQNWIKTKLKSFMKFSH